MVGLIKKRLFLRVFTSSRELVEQRLCLFEIGRAEAFAEPDLIPI
jgi:hypothetical protein